MYLSKFLYSQTGLHGQKPIGSGQPSGRLTPLYQRVGGILTKNVPKSVKFPIESNNNIVFCL